MTRAHLVACSACARHVRATEATCPFCKAALAVAASPRKAPTERLSRAALYALGVGSLTVAAACSSSSTPVSVDHDGGQDDAVTAHPVYGAPAPGIDAGSPDDSGADDASPDVISAQPAYGAPAQGIDADVDSGADEDAGPVDGGHNDALIPAPPYGTPPGGGDPGDP
jgi:hypothetical protein